MKAKELFNCLNSDELFLQHLNSIYFFWNRNFSLYSLERERRKEMKLFQYLRLVSLTPREMVWVCEYVSDAATANEMDPSERWSKKRGKKTQQGEKMCEERNIRRKRSFCWNQRGVELAWRMGKGLDDRRLVALREKREKKLSDTSGILLIYPNRSCCCLGASLSLSQFDSCLYDFQLPTKHSLTAYENKKKKNVKKTFFYCRPKWICKYNCRRDREKMWLLRWIQRNIYCWQRAKHSWIKPMEVETLSPSWPINWEDNWG